MKEPLSLLAVKSKLMSVLSNYSLKIQLFERIKKRLKIKIFLVKLIKIEYSIYYQSIVLSFYVLGCKSSVLVGRNVRNVVTCAQCKKQRCIYSELKSEAVLRRCS